MKISQIHRLLTEYNKSGQKITTLAAPGGEKASGKNYDNMITGASQPYKVRNNDTQYMKIYPVLGGIIKNLKNDEMGGEKIVLGRALVELNDLNKMSQLKKDEEGKYILPFGDGVRLEKKNGKFFISVAKKEDKDETNFSDNDLNSLPL